MNGGARQPVGPAAGVLGVIEIPVADLAAAAGFYNVLFPHWTLTEYAAGTSLVTETGGGPLVVKILDPDGTVIGLWDPGDHGGT